MHNAHDRVSELNAASAKLAKQSADAYIAKTGRQVVVAGSMGPTGELFEPLGALTYSAAVQGFARQASALADGGVDLLWIETMSSNEEVAAAIEAAKMTGLPVCSTMTFDTAGRSMMGVIPGDFASYAVELGADFVGANCGIGPAELMHSVQGILGVVDGTPVVAKGNCGIPDYVDGAIHYHGTPKLMAEYALFARDAGAKIIGGCCGTSPAHVAAMAHALNNTVRRPLDRSAMTFALGAAWAGLDISSSDELTDCKAVRGGRRGRRS